MTRLGQDHAATPPLERQAGQASTHGQGEGRGHTNNARISNQRGARGGGGGGRRPSPQHAHPDRILSLLWMCAGTLHSSRAQERGAGRTLTRPLAALSSSWCAMTPAAWRRGPARDLPCPGSYEASRGAPHSGHTQ